MNKAYGRFFLFLIPILALSVAVLFLQLKNNELTKMNRSLLASNSSLQAKAQQLKSKNRVLFKTLIKNASLVKGMKGQKQAFQETIDSLKKQEEAIQFEITRSQEEMNAALAEKTYLEDMLIHKTRQIESLKIQNPAPAQNTVDLNQATAAGADISAKIKEKENQIRTLTEQNRALSTKMDRLYQVTTSEISEINVAKIALEDTVTGAKDKINQEWNTVNLGSISIDKKGPTPPVAAAPEAVKSGPKTSGKVLAVNDSHGFVVVDLGKIDNLSMGANLEILREGKNIASLSVLEIRDVMTACNIKNLETGEKIRVNDLVRVQK